jgi:hypothetical protein
MQTISSWLIKYIGLRISKNYLSIYAKEGDAVANHAKSYLFYVMLLIKYSNS